MNSKNFLVEMEDYVKKSYQEFNQYQQYANEILDYFHDLCIDNNINYTLAYGSLLGAIRDNGQIPWDYDIDVVVPIYERQKIIELLEKTLPENFYYAYINNVDKYPLNCLRICKKGFPFTTIHVDVFFLIPCSSSMNEAKKFSKKIHRFDNYRYLKYCTYWSKFSDDGIKNKILNIFRRLRSILIFKWLFKSDKMLFKYDFKSSKYCLPFGTSDCRIYETKWFLNPIEYKVNQKIKLVPKDYDKVLKKIYGNYKEYFDISCRFDEFYEMLKNIRKRKEDYLIIKKDEL